MPWPASAKKLEFEPKSDKNDVLTFEGFSCPVTHKILQTDSDF